MGKRGTDRPAAIVADRRMPARDATPTPVAHDNRLRETPAPSPTAPSTHGEPPVEEAITAGIRVLNAPADPKTSGIAPSAPVQRMGMTAAANVSRSIAPHGAHGPRATAGIERTHADTVDPFAIARPRTAEVPPQTPSPVRLEAMGAAPARADLRPVARPDMTTLRARPPKLETPVHIERIAVTVQAPPPVPATSAATAPGPAPSTMRTPSARTFRNPWASYHVRRD
jgi:hypothetical protein